MNIHLKYYFPLFVLLFLSCHRKPLEIYRLDNFSRKEVINGRLSITEVFILTNIPSDDKKLKILLEEFNQVTLNNDTLKKEPLTRTRSFYRQSKNLNADFKSENPNKAGYFDKADLSGFYKDKIYLSRWTISKKVTGYNTWYLNSTPGETKHYRYNF
jgi:hypothetical protein